MRNWAPLLAMALFAISARASTCGGYFLAPKSSSPQTLAELADWLVNDHVDARFHFLSVDSDDIPPRKGNWMFTNLNLAIPTRIVRNSRSWTPITMDSPTLRLMSEPRAGVQLALVLRPDGPALYRQADVEWEAGGKRGDSTWRRYLARLHEVSEALADGNIRELLAAPRGTIELLIPLGDERVRQTVQPNSNEFIHFSRQNGVQAFERAGIFAALETVRREQSMPKIFLRDVRYRIESQVEPRLHLYFEAGLPEDADFLLAMVRLYTAIEEQLTKETPPSSRPNSADVARVLKAYLESHPTVSEAFTMTTPIGGFKVLRARR